jgi:glutathione S-transferase
MRQLFELCGRDTSVRFSPYVWRVKLALHHKDLEFESVPVRFLEKKPLESAQSKTVPVLNDDGTWVSDSLKIAFYLDQTYPEKPLFGGPIAEGQAKILNAWMNSSVLLGIFRMIAADIHSHLDDKNGAYFRETREKFLGCTLEQSQASRHELLPVWQAGLAPLRAGLKDAPFLAGDTPAWPDYSLFGTFMWARIASLFELLAEDDPLHAWRERMLDQFDGLGRSHAFAG